MKTLFLTSALVLSIGMSAAFASVTIYSDGSSNKSDAMAGSSPTGARVGMANTKTWHKTDGVKVVRFGPPEAGSNAG
jgi:hypothetical protein